MRSRVLPRFFDQVGHETMYASSGNKHFFNKYCHCQTYQNYEFLTQKNDFESTNFEMLEEVVHNFGKSDDDMIQ